MCQQISLQWLFFLWWVGAWDLEQVPFIIHSHNDSIMYWICLHHIIRQAWKLVWLPHIAITVKKYKALFLLCPRWCPLEVAHIRDWALLGKWSAFQPKALYIDSFNLTSLPRNFVVACYFQGDRTWENSSISVITLTLLIKKSHLLLIAELLNSAWQLQCERLRSGLLVAYLHIHLKLFFRTVWKCLSTQHLVTAKIWSSPCFWFFFFFVFQITDEYL